MSSVLPSLQSDSAKYTLLWIPQSGLFYSGGEFFDGQGNHIPWSRTIPLYSSHAQAVAEKEKQTAKRPDAKGEIIVLKVAIR